MAERTTPPESAVSPYQRALDAFRRGAPDDGGLEKRMSELISLLDLSTTLSSSLSSDAILDAALLIVMGELCATRGCVLVRVDERFELRAQRGTGAPLPPVCAESALPGRDVSVRAEGEAARLGDPTLQALCLVRKGDRVIAVIGLGVRADAAPHTPEGPGVLGGGGGAAGR